MSDELKPCPFCQSSAFLRNNPHGDVYWVECSASPYHIDTVTGTREQVISFWNTRPIEDALHEELEQIKRERNWLGEHAAKREMNDPRNYWRDETTPIFTCKYWRTRALEATKRGEEV